MKKFISIIITSSLLTSVTLATGHPLADKSYQNDIKWKSEMAVLSADQREKPSWVLNTTPWTEDGIIYVVGESPGWHSSKLASRNLAITHGAIELTKHDPSYSNDRYNKLQVRDAWVESNDEGKYKTTILLFSEPLEFPLIPVKETNPIVIESNPISKEELEVFSEEITEMNAQIAQQQEDILSSEARALAAANALADEMREEAERRVEEAKEISEAQETEEEINNTRNMILGGVTLGFLILLL